MTQRYPQNAVGASGTGTIIGTMLAVTLSSASPHAVWQSTPAPDPLGPVAVLVGRWAGTTEGQPGKGTVERDYERILGSRFIQVRNRSTYPPQERNGGGEVHEDIGLFSFDSRRKQIVFRQFHTEGFVNQYVMDPSSTPGRLVLTTEAIENIPAGWRARETYVITTPDQMEEIFELAEPGKDFEVYPRNRLNRVR